MIFLKIIFIVCNDYKSNLMFIMLFGNIGEDKEEKLLLFKFDLKKIIVKFRYIFL